MSVIKDYSITRYELAERLLNPTGNSNGIAALPSEINEDGTVDINTYLDRIFADPQYSTLKRKLIDNRPVVEPGQFEILKTHLKTIPGRLMDTGRLMADISLTSMLGINENPSLDYISQEDYKTRIAAGEKPEDIWPHLTDHKNRTYGDWVRHFTGASPGGVPQTQDPSLTIGLMLWDKFITPEQKDLEEAGLTSSRKEVQQIYEEAWTGWNPLKEGFGPGSRQRLEARALWYSQGGEVNDRGEWIDKDGNIASKNHSWTPVDWNTREQYEKRKKEDTFWHGGILKTLKQEILFEWFENSNEEVLKKILDGTMQRANDPAMQELQRWSESVDWFGKGFWDWSAATKKFNNAISGVVPTLVVGGAAGAGTFAATKNPQLSATVGAITMAGMDATGIYKDTYDWAIRHGHSEREAAEMASMYWHTYGAASIVWERIPISMMFKRTTKFAERQKKIRNTYDSKIKQKIMNLKEQALNFGPVSSSKMRAAFVQGAAESLTEIGQLATENALKAGYMDEDFFDLMDFNEIMDSAIGGFGAGGIFGLAGGKPIEGDLPGSIAPKTKIKGGGSASQKTPVKTPVKTTTPPPAATTTVLPTNSSEYAEIIYKNQIVPDSPLPVSSSLATQIKNEESPKTPLSDRIFRDQTNDYEGYPYKKLASIVEDEGWGPIDGMNVEDSTKEAIKSRIAQELVNQNKKVIQNKKVKTEAEQDQLDALNNIDLDKAIESIATGKGIDAAIDAQLDKQLDKDLDKKIEQQVIKGGGIAVTPEMLAKAEDIKPTKTKAKSEKVPAPQEGIEVTPEMLAQATTEDAESIALGKKQGEEVREEVLKEIEDSGQEQKKKTKVSDNPEDSNYYIQSEKSIVSKLSNPKLEKLIKEKEDSKQSIDKVDLKALNAEKSRREAAKKERLDKKKKRLSPAVQKAVDERLAKQEKEFKDKRELELRKKVIEERGPAVLSMNLKKLKLHIKKLRTFKDLESKIELELALEELAEMEANKKARIEKRQKENIVEPIEDIALGSDIDNVVNSALEKIGVKDVDDIGVSSEGLTTEQSDAVKEEVESKKEEIQNNLCMNKGKGE